MCLIFILSAYRQDPFFICHVLAGNFFRRIDGKFSYMCWLRYFPGEIPAILKKKRLK